MKRYAILTALLLPAAGCVTTGRFKAQEAQTQEQTKRADALEQDLKASRKSEEDLKGQIKVGSDQLASLNVQMASVQKSNKDLQESLEAKKGELTKKISDLIKEKDSISQKIADREAELSDLKRRLADTEAAKKSLEQAKAAELAAVKKNYEDLTAGLKSEIAAGEIRITELKGKLTVNMVDRILFDSGQAEVKPDGRKVLDKVGSLLNAVKDKDIRIEGHTDNKPIGGELKLKYPTNWELSTARATAVARYLEDQAKVDPKRLVAAGYGEYRPVAPNDTPESRALNRRIEIVLVPRD